jgi:hypothetical protein
MPRLIWALPCQLVIFDQLTNLPTYVHCADLVPLPSVPGRLPRLTVGSMWARTEGESTLHVKLQLLNPKGEAVYSKETSELKFGESERYGVHLRVEEATAEEFGEYAAVLQHREGTTWIEDGRIPIVVRQARSEAEQKKEVGKKPPRRKKTA